MLRKSWSRLLSGELTATARRMSGDFFLTLTPVCLSTSGSIGVARLTRFCTMTWAMFRSTPCLKVTVRLYDPSLVHCEDM